MFVFPRQSFLPVPCCFWNKIFCVHFWNRTSFQELNVLNKFYDWLTKVLLHKNVSLSGSTVQHFKIFVSFNKNVACIMKKNKTLFIFFSVACSIFWIIFVAPHIKKHKGPRWNFLGACNAAMLHWVRMKMLLRGPRLLTNVYNLTCQHNVA